MKEFIEQLEQWCVAIDGGSNPNVELLSFRAAQGLCSLWTR